MRHVYAVRGWSELQKLATTMKETYTKSYRAGEPDEQGNLQVESLRRRYNTGGREPTKPAGEKKNQTS